MSCLNYQSTPTTPCVADVSICIFFVFICFQKASQQLGFRAYEGRRSNISQRCIGSMIVARALCTDMTKSMDTVLSRWTRAADVMTTLRDIQGCHNILYASFDHITERTAFGGVRCNKQDGPWL
eukprot:235631-Chlamydomonas_euryale.AAC.4